MGKSVGIIEVYGLTAAMVAVDAGCKAASVTVETLDKNKPGNADALPEFQDSENISYRNLYRNHKGRCQYPLYRKSEIPSVQIQ